MAVAFHVYVEGPVDRSPQGMDELAAAISSKFGLPAADLVKRMSSGRFRVKANVDSATAHEYRSALEQVGAVVTIEEAHPTQPNPMVDPQARRQNSAVTPPAQSERSNRYSVSPPSSSARTVMADGRGKAPTSPPAGPRSTAPSTPPATRRATPPAPPLDPRSEPSLPPPFAARAAEPSAPFSGIELPPPSSPRPAASALPPPTGSRPQASALPPATGSRPQTSSLTPATGIAPPRSSSSFSSGLSAAYTPEQSASDLGALGDDALSLSSLDGDAPSEPAISFKEPSTGSIGPAPANRPAAPQKPQKAPAPLDLFGPPDAEELEAEVELASDDLADRARKAGPAAAASASAAPSAPLAVPKTRPIPMMGGVSAPDLPRARFAAGVLLSVLLGFIPAHLLASSREATAFAAIDAQVMSTQIAADTPESFEAIDAFRSTQLDRKKSERRSIALTSMLLWAAAAAGLAYVWFRRVPWDRFGSAR